MRMADKIIMRPVESLIPYARNARTHSEAQVAQIAGSIREFGFTNPVLIDPEGGIIAGHGRDSHDPRLGGHRADHPLLLLDFAARAAATLGADAPGASASAARRAAGVSAWSSAYCC